MMKHGDKENFLKIYANLPLGIRKEIILVLDREGPISWEVAYIEVFTDTKFGQVILEKLKNLEII